ncbi:MAG: hypothetical protein PHO72_10650 [Sphaerochaeta sp.]|nr:hypothetical protein [Sphaerochaeta sp.]
MSSRVLVLLLTMLLLAFPVAGEDMGADDAASPPSVENSVAFSFPSYMNNTPESTGDGILEGVATSDGFFSISYMPDFSVGKLLFQLDLKIKGQVTTDPFRLNLDFTDWEMPTRDESMETLEYSLGILKHYTRFIRSIQYGERYDKIYVRYGKLLGITLGDGALINGFFDRGVGVRATRPGLDVMIDGNKMGIPNAGFEFITNDIYEPTLSAWRIFTRPLYEYADFPTFSKMQVGLSFAMSPEREEGEQAALGRKLIALDFSLPLYEWSSFSLDVFANVLLQTPDVKTRQPALAYRYGFWGHAKSIFIFNASITVPTVGYYHAEYFASDFEVRSQEELDALHVSLGTAHLDAMFSLNFARQGVYLRAKLVSDYASGSYSNHRFLATARIDKRFLNIVSLDLSYEKLYPISTGEGFFAGLGTLRNVVVGATAVIKVKPYTFDIGLSILYDESARSTYKLDTAVRISLL